MSAPEFVNRKRGAKIELTTILTPGDEEEAIRRALVPEMLKVTDLIVDTHRLDPDHWRVDVVVTFTERGNPNRVLWPEDYK